MGIKSLFNTLVKGKEEMLRISMPLTLTLDGAAAAISLAGLAALRPEIISTGLSLLTISMTVAYLLGNDRARHNDRRPDDPTPRP